MKKLAVFVEGFTELLFVEKLLLEIAGANNVVVDQRKIRGGTSVPRSVTTVKAANAATGQRYYVLLVDCGGDSQVKTRIVEEHQNLTNQGFSMIIGIRDVRPSFDRTEIPKLEIGLRTRIKTSLIPVEFILSIMEIEAWFLSEFHHFERIDPAITVDAIRAQLSFDPSVDDMSLRGTPTQDLVNAYAIGGKPYDKFHNDPTINSLDYPFIYFELKNKIKGLDKLIIKLDEFLTVL